jgi:hypothetical protein
VPNKQTLAFRRVSTIGQISECRIKVEHIVRQRPVHRQVTGELGVGNEIDEQYSVISPVRRRATQLIAPELKRPSRAQLTRRQADDIRAFPWLRDKLKVVQPDFIEA